MKLALLLVCCLLISTGALAQVRSGNPKITITVDKSEVGMGRTITITAQAVLADGSPAAGAELLPYANGARWGNHACRTQA
jgi:hypothetical protein